jgi:ABC-2 type transport system permease protein
MDKVWIIARHEYLHNVRRTSFIIITALVPVLGALILLIATFFGGQAAAFLERSFAPEVKEIGIVDQLGAFTPILASYEDRYSLFSDEVAGRAALRADEIGSLMIIPQDYIDSGRTTLVINEGDLSASVGEDSASMRAFFVDHLLRDEDGVDRALRERLRNPFMPMLVGLDPEGQSEGGPWSRGLNIVAPFLLGVLLVMTIFIASGYLLQGVNEEKTSRIMEILLSSVTARELLAGKVIGLGALGLTQILVWLLSVVALSWGAAGLLGIAVPLLVHPEVLSLGVVYYVLGFLVYAVLMGAIGAVGSTQQESQQLASIFSLTAAIPLMISGLMFTNPDMILVRVLSWFPLTAPTMMLLRLPMVEVPVLDLVGSIAVLVITIPAILWAGSKVFRMGLLMYGKRPSLKRIIRTLREA